MRDGFGIVQLSGKPGEQQKRGKASVGELETRRSGRVCFPLVSPGVMMGEGETRME